MSEWISSILLLLIGAVVGAITTYFAGYSLEKRRWLAKAAILRKDQIYAPIFDELSSKKNSLMSFKRWARASSGILRFHEWSKLRDTSLGIVVPDRLRRQLDDFDDDCDRYNGASSRFSTKVQEVFPDKHVGFYDYGVALRLSDKMLVDYEGQNEVVLEYLRLDRPAELNLGSYWTTTVLKEMQDRIEELDEWEEFQRVHSLYVEGLMALHSELGSRIERITGRYQKTSSRL